VKNKEAQEKESLQRANQGQKQQSRFTKVLLDIEVFLDKYRSHSEKSNLLGALIPGQHNLQDIRRETEARFRKRARLPGEVYPT